MCLQYTCHLPSYEHSENSKTKRDCKRPKIAGIALGWNLPALESSELPIVGLNSFNPFRNMLWMIGAGEGGTLFLHNGFTVGTPEIQFLWNLFITHGSRPMLFLKLPLCHSISNNGCKVLNSTMTSAYTNVDLAFQEVTVHWPLLKPTCTLPGTP